MLSQDWIVKMDIGKINMQSPFSLAVIISFIMGVFGLVNFLSPSFAQIKENQIEIENQKVSISKLEKAQDKYHEHILNISNSLSEIEGRLKAMSEEKHSRLRQGR